MTNIRLVWYAESNETFNISLPYIHINSVFMLKIVYILLVECKLTLYFYKLDKNQRIQVW